jgi:hypothetical protein
VIRTPIERRKGSAARSFDLSALIACVDALLDHIYGPGDNGERVQLGGRGPWRFLLNRGTLLSKVAPMRVALALIALLATSGPGPALADNPYAAAGISNPAHVTQFLARLRQAVAADDHATVAAMVNYPLTVSSSGGRPMTYRDAAALSANYARVFTPEVKAAVAAANADNLFARDQGVMIGNGEIWMNEIRGSMKIITVNHTR